MTHQTSWLGSTGVWGGQQKQLVRSLLTYSRAKKLAVPQSCCIKEQQLLMHHAEMGQARTSNDLWFCQLSYSLTVKHEHAIKQGSKNI